MPRHQDTISKETGRPQNFAGSVAGKVLEYVRLDINGSASSSSPSIWWIVYESGLFVCLHSNAYINLISFVVRALNVKLPDLKVHRSSHGSATQNLLVYRVYEFLPRGETNGCEVNFSLTAIQTDGNLEFKRTFARSAARQASILLIRDNECRAFTWYQKDGSRRVGKVAW